MLSEKLVTTLCNQMRGQSSFYDALPAFETVPDGSQAPGSCNEDLQFSIRISLTHIRKPLSCNEPCSENPYVTRRDLE